MSLLELARRRKAAQPALSVPVNTDPLSSPSPLPLANPQSDSDATPNPFIGPASSYMIPSTERLKNFGERALKRIKLSDESQAEFRQYIETTNLEERYALQFIHTLQVEDLLNKDVEERAASWRPSKALAKTLREYIWTLLLLPNIWYYTGTVENAVISAARSNKVKGLPAAKSNECPELVKWLGREFSIFRSDLKTMVKTSMGSGSELRNIADLAEELLQHSPGVNHTLGLYYWLAFMRRHLRLHNHSIHDFWPKVDEDLEELHEAGPEDFLDSMKLNLEEDIAIYEDPAKSTHRPCTDPFKDNCLRDLKTLSSLAPKIQRVAAKKRANKTKKRKHRESEAEEEEEQQDDSPPADEDEGSVAPSDSTVVDG
ncbi:hypothetical protein B0H14DRAFT_3909966 [Mycena olivaceomarginata]|nr:hypothetical protein B0H14DRAFT_3909966 [Mycena olivaceomarginata]